ncbi:hypothetical protein GCM10027446_19200 [Angustibacter peucedani]
MLTTTTTTTTTTTAPSPAPVEPDPSSVTPGVLGFLVVFLLAIATWLLLRNMTGRLRRMKFREEQRLAAEQSPAPPQAPDDDGTDGTARG